MNLAFNFAALSADAVSAMLFAFRIAVPLLCIGTAMRKAKSMAETASAESAAKLKARFKRKILLSASISIIAKKIGKVNADALRAAFPEQCAGWIFRLHSAIISTRSGAGNEIGGARQGALK